MKQNHIKCLINESKPSYFMIKPRTNTNGISKPKVFIPQWQIIVLVSDKLHFAFEVSGFKDVQIFVLKTRHGYRGRY